jgi:hypothetical protein
MATCKAFLAQIQEGTAPWVVQRLRDTYGSMPTDASNFSFWVALVLPIDEHDKARLLPIRSARLRLRLVVHWIEMLNNNWYVRFLVWVGGMGEVGRERRGVVLVLLWMMLIGLVFSLVVGGFRAGV